MRKLQNIRNLTLKRLAVFVLAPVIALTMLAAPAGSLGAFGTQKAEAACGYFYVSQYNGVDYIWTNSGACGSYFSEHGWYVAYVGEYAPYATYQVLFRR